MSERQEQMKSLYNSYNMFTDKAYIIRIKGNEISETLASRCAESCSQVNMKYEYWDAFDGTNESIIPPANIHPFMKMLKIHLLTKVSCFLEVLLFLSILNICQGIYKDVYRK